MKLVRIIEKNDRFILNLVEDENGNLSVVKSYAEDYPSLDSLSQLKNEIQLGTELTYTGLRKIHGEIFYDNKKCLSMDYIEGNDIRGMGPLDIGQFFQFAIEMTKSIAFIHQKGILHRDISSFNILYCTQSSSYKLIDFGTASSIESQIIPHHLVGTPLYVSPELTGRLQLIPDQRSDIYSLGIVFYEMLTGTNPFEDVSDMQIIHKHLAMQATEPSEIKAGIPSTLSRIIMKMISKNPDQRYYTSEGLLYDLEESLLLFRRNVIPRNFEPGSSEKAPPFSDIPDFIGRNNESKKLNEQLKSLISGNSQFTHLSGPKGAGKSYLINTLTPLIIEEQILYLMLGAESKNSIPYAHLFNILENILERLIEEPEELLLKRKERFESDAISDVSFLVEKIPSLANFTKATSLSKNKDSLQSQNRILLALQDLLRFLALPERPLIIHSTESNLMDSESLDFLVSFSEDLRNEFVWIIIESDIEEGKKWEELSESKTLPLQKMEEKEILKIFNSMITGEVINPDEITKQLLRFSVGLPGKAVDIINYWFYHEFLQFDPQRNYWFWEDQSDMPVFPESIITSIKIEEGVQIDIIKWSSLIDGKFSFRMLNFLSEYPEAELRNGLEKLNINGQLVSFRNGNEYYALSGNKEHYNFNIDNETRANKHAKIAAYLNNQEVKDHYRIAYHMNKSIYFGENQFKGNESLLSNLNAGLAAKDEGAFKLARNYLKSALENLGSSTHLEQKVKYDLYLHSAELVQLDSKFEEAESFYEKAIEHSANDYEKAEIFSRQLTLYNHQGKLDKSFKAGRKALKFLGSPIPSDSGKLKILLTLLKIWLKIGNKDPKLLKDLPRNEDKRINLTLKILQDLHTPLFHVSSDLLAYTLLLAFQKVLKHGNSPEGNYVLPGFGAILAIGFNSYKKGWAFTEVGADFAMQFNDKIYQAAGLTSKGAILINYVQPSRNALPMLDEAYKLFKEAGDFTSASLGAMWIAETMFMVGYQLEKFSKRLDDLVSFTYQNGYDDMLVLCLLNKRYVLFLLDRQEEAKNLEAEWFRGKDLITHANESSFKHLRSYYLLTEAYINYYKGEIELGISHIKEIEQILDTLKTTAVIVDYYFVKGLLYYEYSNLASKNGQGAKQLRAVVKKLRKYAGLVEDNFSHRYHLLDALQLQNNGKSYAARTKMREALQLARKYDYVQIEELAARYLAQWFKEQEQKDYARLHFRDSLNACERWGANFLSAKLTDDFPELNGQFGTSKSVSKIRSRRSSGSKSLSLSNPEILMQSALSVSSETDFESLLTAMNQIFMEQAGATRSLLFIQSKNELRVLFEMNDKKSAYYPFPGKSFNEVREIPKSTIQLAMRSLETIVIGDSSKEQRFRFERYFKEKEGISAMVVPMLYRSKLSGILYFENNLLINAFSHAQQELINLLSGQFAVSLQNAQLVEELEERVRQRTEALELEKDRADSLLRNILPVETAEELKHKGKADSKYYKDVSVLFTDFVDFTLVAEKMDPEELVRMLDYYFRGFDKIVEGLGLEKIKTIGDAYLCVSGLPLLDEKHAEKTVAAAQRIVNFVEETKKEGKYSLSIRIGIHSGPVVAGVVGENKFAFDIWGDTVNTAARMENNSEKGKINISKESKKLLDHSPKYKFEYRGKIQAKNKGEIDMYFIVENQLNMPDFDAAIEHILSRLNDELSQDLHYHSTEHTRSIMENVKKIGKDENLSEMDISFLLTAAAYHDSGFMVANSDHEELSCKIVEETLPQFHFERKDIEKVCEMIRATKIPQKPKDQISRVMCDADLYYLGSDSFEEIGLSLYEEFKIQGFVKNLDEWNRIQISFLEKHKFHCDSVIRDMEEKKQKHLEQLKLSFE